MSSPHPGPESFSADDGSSAAESSGRPEAGEHGAAARTQQLLVAQADAARADLAALRRELTRARDELRSLRSAQMSEADEQLVQAAVHADTIAQSAVTSLDELTRHSQHDELTGAPNRTLMLDRLHNAIALARRRATRLAVLFVDLDDFKQINDTLGHAAGDQALQLATQRLQAAVRDSDTVSRHSGDEFLVLLSDIANAADAASVATKILALLAVPARLGAKSLRLSASVGIAVYPDDGADAATLIVRADAAMYRSKRRGAGSYELHGGAATSQSEAGTGAVASPNGLPKADAAFARHEARLQELSNANHELLRAAQVAQRLKTHAEEAHRHQINFVAKAAHAMRTPLSVIRMTVATLFDPAVQAQTASKQRDTLERQTAHLTRLIDDLLDGSLIGGGEFKLDRCSADIDTVVGNAVDASRPAIVLKRQRLHVQSPPRNVTLVCDPMRLAQVFSQLLNNASRRTPEGGDIWISAALSEDDVVVTVADNGAGIAAEVLPRIFDLFVLDAQADDPGLGIGLTVAKELAKAHGGSVDASSAGEDQGSRFVVRIPLRYS